MIVRVPPASLPAFRVGVPGASVVSLGYSEFDAAEVWLVLPVELVADTVKFTWVVGSSPVKVDGRALPAATVRDSPVLAVSV